MKNLKTSIATLCFVALSMGANAQAWTSGTNVLYANPSTTNVGIGTSNPVSKLFINGNMGFLQTNNQTNGIIWRNSSYQKNSAAILPVDFGDYARQGLGFFTGDFANSTTDVVERMRITRSGNVGIGYTNPGAKLDVNGVVRAHEVKVCLNQGCDYVFEDDYKLMNLSDLSNFIKTNKHLPEVAPAAQMEAEGINLSEMNALLLKKVEELTLYVIELKNEIDNLKK